MRGRTWVLLIVSGLVTSIVLLRGGASRDQVAMGGSRRVVTDVVASARRELPGPDAREQAAATFVELPQERGAPADEQELLALVAWLRGLSTEELERLSNSDFGFEKSALIEMLQGLEGPWVVKALGDLAVSEQDPLLKAILAEGLTGVFDSERLLDPAMLPILEALMTEMSLKSGDPHGVAGSLVAGAYGVSILGGQDYVELMRTYLEGSDNPRLLSQGYFLMGGFEGGPDLLRGILTEHSSPDGRLGALEGLRHAADGAVSESEITALGLAALDQETDERNRLLLYEMLVTRGGLAALDAIEQAWRAGKISEIDETATLLALEMEPARAQALFEEALREYDLDPTARQAIYNALGAMPGEEGAEILLGLVRDGELPQEQRLAGLRGLWNREVDAQLAAELDAILTGSDDPTVRVEALRMLIHGETSGAGVDLRSLATLDDSAAVRAEAIQLASMQPGPDTRAWLEERLLEDDSLDVKAAALGALVYHAHYTGDGDAVLDYLARARKLTEDDSALAMIAQGEEMVKGYDPRNLELELAQEVQFWETVARHTDGPASRAFQRQARTLSGLVAALRAAQPGRSATR